jgi:HD-GYP domain-containing protein (c-di-GMP phosphodiesterase class II)
MKHTRYALRIAALLALLAAGFAAQAPAQTGQAAVDKARAAYAKSGDFRAAFDALSAGVPETEADAKVKAAASSLCSDLGLSEYNKKNWKNAWDAFRKALKYQPTNAIATQYYLSMKKSFDTTKLENEGELEAQAKKDQDVAADRKSEADAAQAEAARKAQEAEAARRAQEADAARKVQEAEAARKAQEAEAARRADDEAMLKKAIEDAVAKAKASQPQGVTSDDLQKLMSKLETAQDSNAQIAKSAASAKSESSALKAQLDQQKKLNQETLKTLADLAQKQDQREKSASSAETETIVKALVDNVAEQRRAIESEAKANRRMIAWAFAGVGLIAAGILALIVLSALRARARARKTAAYANLPFDGSSSAPAIPAPAIPSMPLLEFSSPGGGIAKSDDIDLRKQLLRAERLSKMYEDARSGALSWETVRRFSDELDSALKAEILNAAEAKLAEGDLIADEAVLPVIFPFLTDYDDYIRERAEKTARRALLEDKRGPEDEGSPFGVRALMAIPDRLRTILKGRDQSVVTARLARSVAKRMGLSNADCQSAYLAALAHDAGYLMLDVNELQKVIAKPEISEEDFEFIKTHAVQGPSYFGDLEIPQFIRDAMICHHERNDGSGYPDGRKKDEIPLFAKIIGAAETYAALLGPRPDRPRMKSENAIAIIRDSRNKFDREIIDALSQVAVSSGADR